MSTDNLDAYFRLGKDALDLIKSGLAFLPQGRQKDDAKAQVDAAEKQLQASKAELAKRLGYKLCQCTFPPQIMLWREAEGAHVCERPECGRRISRIKKGPEPLSLAHTPWSRSRMPGSGGEFD
jgi:hypothetical protein